MKRLLFLTLLACPGLASGAQADDDEQPVKVPFELLKSQHIVLSVKINGEGPYRLIFDTGAPATLITNKVAEASGVVPWNTRPPVPTPFGVRGQHTIKQLEVGGLQAQGVPAVVMDHPSVTAASKFLGPVEGLIGFSFFARYRMTLDYQTREMTFVPSGFEPPDLLERLLLVRQGKDTKQPSAAAGLWGFRVHKETDDAEPGVNVREVLAGGAAAAAGLKAGDRLLLLDGRWTDTVADCHAAAVHVRPGTAARLQVRRDGEKLELTVQVRPGL